MGAAVPSILVLGNVNVDLVLGEVDGWPAVGTEIMVERSEMRPGGSAGNSALALAGLGVAHRLLASTGNDPNGTWLRGQFASDGCDWLIDDCDTTITVGIVHKGGDRAFFTTPGHLQKAPLDDLVARLPAAPREGAMAIVSGGFLMPQICAGTERLLAELSGRGWLTAIDPGWPPQGWTGETVELMGGWLRLADFALLNSEEAAGYARGDDDAARRIASGLRPRQTLVVKEGARGVRAFHAGGEIAVEAPAVRVIDTVGAGDTFNAAFMASLVSGANLKTALRHGVVTASRAISTFPRSYS
ncbi:carbohydrate kinase family protein [Aquamicrobium sp. LC103]|uniref:carbohydrate kinase family protein n=1 Tax=Aquamicrobium sp. LC103 TaxID=1120658 RepID=UPI00063EA3B5|nr:carbohydrate kinase family protein [Aquamicrobium sp. LC103]TKT69318.1 carbohydrate kinase family protein [Aquamicrobium sp. LC103]